jgi:hypothetical protein
MPLAPSQRTQGPVRTIRRAPIGLVRAAAYSSLILLILVKVHAPEEVREIIGGLVTAALIGTLLEYSIRSLWARLRDNTPDGVCILVARAKSPTLFYLGVAAIGFGTVSFVMSYSTWDAPIQWWPGASVVLFAFGAFYAFFGAFQLKIADRKIEYWSLGGHQSLKYDEIEKARIRIGPDSSRPGIRLEILPHGPDKEAISVALKAFRKADMDRVFDWLGPKLEDPGKLTVIKGDE